jgi:hypothetical protein
MNVDRSVAANFSPTAATFNLKIVFAGNGSGAVGWTPPGCTGTCSISLPPGANVVLAASPDPGSTFGGWNGGGCAASMIECNVTMNSDVTVTATFNFTGPVGVKVPNVVGMTQSTATSTITGAGLTVGTVTQQSSSTVASGSVISESPAAGTSVTSGSAVNLVVSTGPVQVVVPNVVGQTQAAATTAITGAGLVVGTVTQQSSSTVASGSVISESPAAGTNVASGSAVNVVVSTGGGSGSGGGGGIDALTLGALLSSLFVVLRRAGVCLRAGRLVPEGECPTA